MKSLQNISKSSKKHLTLVAIFLSQGLLWAQDKKVDVSLSVDNGEETVWYGQPWMWIVGAAVFIILIVAVSRGGAKSN